MTTLPAWLVKKLRRECQAVIGGVSFDLEVARQVIAALAPRRKNEKQRAGAKDKSMRAAARRAASAEIRRAVMIRASGRCENCFVQRGFLTWDHWLGGSGRRKPKESEETSWALCLDCNEARTENRPDAAYWNDRFARHCFKHGYPAPAHVEHAELPGRAAR